MKFVSAIVFLVCFLTLTFSRSLTLLNFYLNQDAIIAKYCVNKNRPKMHCDGKCFLAKKIKEQEKREAGSAVMELSKIEVFSSRSFFAEALRPKFATLNLLPAVFIEHRIGSPFQNSVFRPPC